MAFRRFRGADGAENPSHECSCTIAASRCCCLLIATVLAGCSTGMGKDECLVADWRTIGYEDGLHGYTADRIGAHRVACAKHQIAPNLAL